MLKVLPYRYNTNNQRQFKEISTQNYKSTDLDELRKPFPMSCKQPMQSASILRNKCVNLTLSTLTILIVNIAVFTSIL